MKDRIVPFSHITSTRYLGRGYKDLLDEDGDMSVTVSSMTDGRLMVYNNKVTNRQDFYKVYPSLEAIREDFDLSPGSMETVNGCMGRFIKRKKKEADA